MDRTPVRSSNLRSVGYAAGTLQIEFSTGAVFNYADVPGRVWKAFMAAESAGRYFYHHIRDRYAVSKVPIEVLRKGTNNMAITDGANRNPNAFSVGQPQSHGDAGTRAALSSSGGVAGGGDQPAGPTRNGGQDAGTAAAMKKGSVSYGSTNSSGNPG